MTKAKPRQIIIRFGDAGLSLEPLAPLAWCSLLESALGLGCLAEAVFPKVGLAWRGVTLPDGSPADAAWDWPSLPVEVARQVLDAACQPLLSKAEKAGLERLAGHLRHAADFPGVDCDQCRKLGGVSEDDCAACTYFPPPVAGEFLLQMWDHLPGDPLDRLRHAVDLAGRLGHPNPWALVLQMSSIAALRKHSGGQ